VGPLNTHILPHSKWWSPGSITTVYTYTYLVPCISFSSSHSPIMAPSEKSTPKYPHSRNALSAPNHESRSWSRERSSLNPTSNNTLCCVHADKLPRSPVYGPRCIFSHLMPSYTVYHITISSKILHTRMTLCPAAGHSSCRAPVRRRHYHSSPNLNPVPLRAWGAGSVSLYMKTICLAGKKKSA